MGDEVPHDYFCKNIGLQTSSIFLVKTSKLDKTTFPLTVLKKRRSQMDAGKKQEQGRINFEREKSKAAVRRPTFFRSNKASC